MRFHGHFAVGCMKRWLAADGRWSAQSATLPPLRSAAEMTRLDLLGPAAALVTSRMRDVAMYEHANELIGRDPQQTP